jgi:hypothetical protein
MKGATVYILDASSSMATLPLLDGRGSFEVARSHVIEHLGHAMHQSVTNEASIVLCRTRATRNHVCVKTEDEPEGLQQQAQYQQYQHLTEVTFGLSRTTVDHLRQIAATTADDLDSDSCGVSLSEGSVLHALQLAVHALTSKTAGKKYARRIIVYTDAVGHDYEMAVSHYERLVQNLQALDCPVYVVALQSLTTPTDFVAPDGNVSSSIMAAGRVSPTTTVPVVKPDQVDSLPKPKSGSKPETVSSLPNGGSSDTESSESTSGQASRGKRIKREEGQSDDDESDDPSAQDDEDILEWDTRADRWELLSGLVNITGGIYLPVATRADVPPPGDAFATHQRPASLTKSNLLLGPKRSTSESNHETDLAYHQCAVKMGLCHAEKTLPLMKSGAYQWDSSLGTIPQRDEEGDVVLSELAKHIRYVRPDPKLMDEVYESSQTADAYPYGSECKVIDSSFEHSWKRYNRQDLAIEVLGYLSQDDIDETHRKGPCHVVSGNTSIHACAAIEALSQALDDANKVALVTYTKRRGFDAYLGSLWPAGKHLHLTALPFSGETKALLEDWQETLEEEAIVKEETVACDLIDSLWLSDDRAETILRQNNPYHQAWYTTVVHRAVYPNSTDLKIPRAEHNSLEWELDDSAQMNRQAFREAFPLFLKPVQPKKSVTGRQTLTFRNHLNDE